MSKQQQEFFTRFNSQIVVRVPSGTSYDVRLETKAEKDYAAEEQKAMQTLSELELEKWYETHEIPRPEYKSRFIPDGEDWDAVDALMIQSLNVNSDLLWERYKNNTYKYEKGNDY